MCKIIKINFYVQNSAYFLKINFHVQNSAYFNQNLTEVFC